MFVYQKLKFLIRISLLGTGINLFWYDFFILIGCLLQNHHTSGVSQTLGSFLCLLSLILQYYSIQKLKLVLFYSYCLLFMCIFLYIVLSFLFHNLYSYILQTQFFIMDVFHNFLNQVIATTLKLGNRNHIFLIHHLPPNHD